MFEDKSKNNEMILGAYKKLKSYFYYDKTILYNKMRLSTWESDENEMNLRIDELSNFLSSIETSRNQDYLRLLISGVALFPCLKLLRMYPQRTICLQIRFLPNNELDKVNFFIKAPVELMILDTIWMLIDKQNCIRARSTIA